MTDRSSASSTDSIDSTDEMSLESVDESLSDPRALLLAKLGHNGNPNELPDDLINRYLAGAKAFESGDNRATTNALRSLLSRGPSDALRDEARAMLEWIKPDRIALLVALLCALGLVLVWVLAVRGY